MCLKNLRLTVAKFHLVDLRPCTQAEAENVFFSFFFSEMARPSLVRVSRMNTFVRRPRIRATRDDAFVGPGKFGKQRRIIFQRGSRTARVKATRLKPASETGEWNRRVNLVIEFYAIARRYKSWRIRRLPVTCLHLSYISHRHQRTWRRKVCQWIKPPQAEERTAKPLHFVRFDAMDGLRSLRVILMRGFLSVNSVKEI